MYPARSSGRTALSATSRKSDPSGQCRSPGAATAHGKRSAVARMSVASSSAAGPWSGCGAGAGLLRAGGGLLEVGEEHGLDAASPRPVVAVVSAMRSR